MQTSKFGSKPRAKSKTELCAAHGEYERKLVEAFEGENRVMSCPRCRWEGLNIAPVDGQAYRDALSEKRWETLNSALFATGIAKRFRDCSLDNYRTPLNGQKTALNACRAYVDQFEENYQSGRSLLLLGNFGNGKTHLGCAILKAVVTRYGVSALYAPAPDIISSIKASFGPDAQTTEQQILAELISVDLLLIDEIGAQGGTEFERNALHHLIDGRYRSQLPTIITSNLPSAELTAYIGDRALDRLRENGGQAVVFDWTSARGADE
ncbi:hypothetical protein 3S11_36 [uncultured Caudovirales phage]|uniref:AAA+ ATPase domain-containing protein n=1 Tax=uncultured Caudovirales phage TaxID=2100421 RepID=A0A2H4J2L2_9CAUD|nr:hypothetical protein 3S11_36 [uncultured Caudovirales phage]